MKVKRDEIDEQFEDMLEELKDSVDDWVSRRIQRIGFAKAIFFICVKGRSESFVFSKELAKFRNITTQGASYLLNDFVNIGLLSKRNVVENLTEFWLVRDENGLPKINKYFKMACKVLGIKNKLVREYIRK